MEGERERAKTKYVASELALGLEKSRKKGRQKKEQTGS